MSRYRDTQFQGRIQTKGGVTGRPSGNRGVGGCPLDILKKKTRHFGDIQGEGGYRHPIKDPGYGPEFQATKHYSDL